MTRTEIRRALEKVRRTGGSVPMVCEADMPILRREARKMGLRIASEPFDRSENDCLRAAVSYAYGIPYADTPSIDPLAVGAGRQQDAWEAWAAERNLRWWHSDTLAPFAVSRWIAGVTSEHPGCTHAVVMEADRLLYDPANKWIEVRRSDVREAKMLLPVAHPLWQTEIPYWPITTTDARAT